MADATERGRLVVISGPSGAGKTTVCDRLLEEPDIERAITATTRPPRDGEVPGVHYHFLDEETFRRDVAAGRFLEHAEVHGRWYGTPAERLEEQLAGGRTILLSIDVQGAEQLMDRGVDASFIFIEPPDLDELRRRLDARGSEDVESLKLRLENARAELARKHRYDHVVVNDDLERTVEKVLAVIRTARETN